MNINRDKVYESYMEWVDEVSEACDWKTHFTPLEIVHQICHIIETEKEVVNNNIKNEINQVITELDSSIEQPSELEKEVESMRWYRMGRNRVRLDLSNKLKQIINV
jgi:GH35 family endo-1,4-beta-xylanase